MVAGVRKAATIIENIIGRTANRNNNPIMMKTEPAVSAVVIRIRDKWFPIPNGSGNVLLKVSKLLILAMPCVSIRIPMNNLNSNRPKSVL